MRISDLSSDVCSSDLPISWLEARTPGFRRLSTAERAAISNFSLLWSLFEAKTLGRNASAHRILALAHEWAANQVLHAERFDALPRYFRNRYFTDGPQSYHFQHLQIGRQSCRERVCQ